MRRSKQTVIDKIIRGSGEGVCPPEPFPARILQEIAFYGQNCVMAAENSGQIYAHDLAISALRTVTWDSNSELEPFAYDMRISTKFMRGNTGIFKRFPAGAPNAKTFKQRVHALGGFYLDESQEAEGYLSAINNICKITTAWCYDPEATLTVSVERPIVNDRLQRVIAPVMAGMAATFDVLVPEKQINPMVIAGFVQLALRNNSVIPQPRQVQ